MSTLPSESITTSEDRASAVRAAATDVAAPTASAAFSSNPRRLTPWSPLLLGGPNDECITIVSEQDQKEIEAHLWDASGLSRPPGEDETYVCYAAKGNSLVIRSTGRLAKCTVALNDSCNDIGWISEDGEIRVDQAKYQRWIAPLVEADWENVGCPLPSVMQQAQVDGVEESGLIA